MHVTGAQLRTKIPRQDQFVKKEFLEFQKKIRLNSAIWKKNGKNEEKWRE